MGLWLGQGIADLAAVLDPEVVVIGGGVSMLGEMVLDPARERLERALPGRGFRPGPRIVVAELGPQAGSSAPRPGPQRRRRDTTLPPSSGRTATK